MNFRRLWMSLVVACMAAWAASAQTKSSLAGDYVGVIAGALHLKLHITGTHDALTGTLDSTDQGVSGMLCTDFQVEGDTLSFRVPVVNGSWKGTFGPDAKTLTGTWTQGRSLELIFSRDTFEPSEKPSAVDGVWLGSVKVGDSSVRAQIRVKSDRAGREFCSFDSLDQGALDWECTNVTLQGSDFSFEVPKARGRWSGKVAEDQQALKGTWTQGAAYPLEFSRQAAAVKAAPRPEDPAIAPVKLSDLQQVLDRDLALARLPIFRRGPLSEGTEAGITIGVVQAGVRRIFTFGTAKADSVFEIGSITKTFTGLLLARMVEQGKVRFDEPVRELLPADTVAKPEGAEITLLDLAIQHSGLPRMPNNFRPANPQNPYAGYGAANLYEFIREHGVAKPADAKFLYSNVGLGLLGQALANRAGMSYPALLQQEIVEPLGMKDTAIQLTPEMQARFIQGHDGEHRHAHPWDLDALAGAGAIRSTAADMLTYLEAQLHPEKFPGLAAAIRQTQQLRGNLGPGMRIGLAWLYIEKDGAYWHNGGTGGYSSYAFFDPKNDCAGVVLFNTTVLGGFSDRLGAHVRQRLVGEPAVSVGY